ncbi:MAG: AI-2E family transporter [Nocardioides sp.]
MSNDAADPDPRTSVSPAERLTERLAHQRAAAWALLRSERRTPPPAAVHGGPSNLTRANVPWGVDAAAAWAWRFLVIAGAGYVLIRLIGYFALIAVPVAVALLITALAAPLVNRLHRAGLPRQLVSLLTVIGGLAFVVALLTFAGQQVANGANDLATQVSAGLGEIRSWLKTGPLHASDTQINDYIKNAQDALSQRAQSGTVLSTATDVGAALGHVLAGLFIVLFSTYFFLSDGSRIWAWFVRLAPRVARARVDSSGRVAWISLTQFVRATVIVAVTDAVGVMIGATILQVPFVLAIGVLVFLGAFVPIIGAAVAGSVAVLVALVDHGFVTALLMLAVVVVVQQIESHALQPFLMGRFVSLHPLGIILAIGAGVLVSGVTGALVAVPLAAAANAVVQHLAADTAVGDRADEQLEEEYAEDDPDPDPEQAAERADEQPRNGDPDHE